MAELTSARKSRGQLKLSVTNSLQKLHGAIKTADLDPPPEEDLAEASLRATRAIEAVDKYESSIDKVNLLESEVQTDQVVQENKIHDDSLLTYRSQLDDMLGKLSRLEARAKKFASSNSQVSARAQVKAPPLLAASVDLNSFISWRQAFHDWARVTGVAKEERSRYVSHLKALLSIEMRSTLELAIGIDSDSDKSVDAILEALYAHIRASRNVAIDRVDFEKRVQRSGEKFDEFYVDLKKLARNSDYKGCCLDSRLITRLMAGCHDPEVREELMTKDISKLTLAEAVALARSKEAAKKSANVIVGSTRSVNAITPVSRDKSPSRHSRVRHKSASRQNSNSTICSQTGKSGQKGCSSCGFPTHLTKDGTCPASTATCAKCGKQGHYSHVCNSQASQGRQVNAIQVGGCITY